MVVLAIAPPLGLDLVMIVPGLVDGGLLDLVVFVLKLVSAVVVLD